MGIAYVCDEIGIPLGWTNDAQRFTIGARACWIVPLAILELVSRRLAQREPILMNKYFGRDL